MGVRLLAAGLAATFLVAAAGSVAAQPEQGPPPPAPDGPLQTPGAYGHSSVGHAAAAPLHDLNLARQKIPPVLLAAMADPYAKVPKPSCAAINVRIGDLNAALGPDFDEPNTTEDPNIKGKTGPLALSLMHGAAESLLPFNSYVSTLTGAQRHDALVLQAIDAGGIRRGYLKGLGESHGCRPPAAPIHRLYPEPPIQDTRSVPLYPIR